MEKKKKVEKVEEVKYEEEEKPIGVSFDNFPEITKISQERLNKDGIVGLLPIQEGTFNHIYNKEDVIARDLTGTGKTLAFLLPLVERFRSSGYFRGMRSPRCLILAPTRELALQVSTELEKLVRNGKILVFYNF